MIEKLELTNFTKFANLTGERALTLSPKINIIIGENGTGKTHLLKTCYAVASAMRTRDARAGQTDDVANAITQKLLNVFMPHEGKLGKLRLHGAGTDKAEVKLHFAHDQSIDFSFNYNSTKVVVDKNRRFDEYTESPVYVPTKEVLSFMKGFSSLYETYGLSFDQTYQDICLRLDLPEIRPETMHEKSNWAVSEIERICEGKFVFYGGGNVTFKAGEAEYSANVIAEGFRKIGMLSRLLLTGSIQPGVSGPLFWDEPETNMNPKLMKLLVQIMLELSRNGQQIVLATHDYVLLKWFDLLKDKGLGDHVRFHSLYKDETSRDVIVKSTDDYLAIAPNPIGDTFNDLIKAHARAQLKGSGK
jgi:energy-coupling factor transporter ATP-binding protein EcfA2